LVGTAKAIIMGGPARLFFWSVPHAAVGEHSVESRSLAQLQGALRPRVDPRGLAPWVRAWPPLSPADTPYTTVRARIVEENLGPMEPLPRSPGEAPEYLLRALEAAMGRALSGVKRVAILTGGGLDSAVLLALAVRWARRTGGSAFAVASDHGGKGDDRPYLRALEDHLGCEVVRVRPEGAADAMRFFRSGVDGAPFPWATGPIEVDLLERAKAHGAERALSGAGGDELFGGDARALSDVALRGHPLRALRAARALRGFGEPRSRALSWIVRPAVARALPRSLRRARARRSARPAPKWAGPILRELVEEQAHRGAAQALQPRRSDRIETVIDDPHRVYLAWNRHLEEVASGLDCWDPYQDSALIRAVRGLPRELLLLGDCWRGLLREAARGLLPEALRLRMDKASSEEALVRFIDVAGGVASLRPLATVERLADLRLAEPGPFQEAFARFEAHPEDGPSWVTLWPALAVESFLREVDG
jgi:asparagine synthase (glutamine-hydrolysing)